MEPQATPEVPRLSYSIAKTLVTKSALHAYEEHRLLGNNRKLPTPAMDEGRLLERLVLRFQLDEVVVVQADTWKGKEAKEQREAAILSGKLAVLTEKYEDAKVSAEAIYERFLDCGYDLRDPAALIQHRIEWVNRWGNACSAVLDYFNPRTGLILDLKKAADASDKKLERVIYDLGYDIQEHGYREAAQAEHPELAGRLRFHFLFAETDAPYAVNPIELAGSMSEIGRRRWQEANEKWAECMKTGVWPGYARKNKRIEATAWQLAASMETDLMMNSDFELKKQLEAA